MPDNEHRHLRAVLALKPHLQDDSATAPPSTTRPATDLLRLEVVGVQARNDRLPVHAPSCGLVLLGEVVPRDDARVCEANQLREEPRVLALCRHARRANEVCADPAQLLARHVIHVYLVDDLCAQSGDLVYMEARRRTHVALVGDDEVVVVYRGDVFEVRALVLRDDVAEDALLGWVGEVNRDELVLGCVLVGE